MGKTLTVFRHEFLNMITKTGYIIITFIVLLLPLLFLLAYGIFEHVQGRQGTTLEESSTIGFMDNTGLFEAYTLQEKVDLIQYESQGELTQALLDGEIEEYFIVPTDYLETGLIQRYSMGKEIEPPRHISSAIRTYLLSNIVEEVVPSNAIDRIHVPLRLVTTMLTETGEVATDQGGWGAIILPMVFSLLIGISLMSLASFLLQGLGEEKENRVIEILLSSVSTGQLLAGKVLGVGAAGFLQILVWLLVPALLMAQAADTMISGIVRSLLIPGDFLALAIVYFILGYLFFGVLSAGIAAVSPTSRDGQQLAMGLLLPMFIPLWLSSVVMIFPENPLWTALTVFPITAPTMMIVRFGITDIPAWEIIASISVMILTISGGLFVAARVFRLYLLMYGKRPSLAEIIRTLRNA